MAIAASAVWRVRKAGNNLNGGGYDGVSYPGGTDYSQQDAAQATFSGTLSTSSASSTTLSDSGNGFTAAMVGNAVQIASAFYFVVSYQSAGAITLDRAPGSISGASGKLGGAHADFWTYADGGKAVGGRYASGHYVDVRGSGSDNPSAVDYTATSYVNWSSGDQTIGKISYVSSNGRAHVSAQGLLVNGGTYNRFQGFKVSCAANPGFTSNGVIQAQGGEVLDCLFDAAGQDVTMLRAQGTFVSRCEFTNTGGGSAGSLPLFIMADFGSMAESILVHGSRGTGVEISGGANTLSSSIIAKNTLDGIVVSNNGGYSGMRNTVRQCTVDANGGNGLTIASGDLPSLAVYNSLFTNHTGAGKAGVYVSGTAVSNDRAKGFIDWNIYNNNTGHLSGLSMGANSQVGDPGYVSQSTGDYRIGTAFKAAALAGFMSRSSGWASPTSYTDPGAVQRQEPTGGGGGIGPTLTVVS